MAKAFDYKVRWRTMKPGQPYVAADEFLASFGPSGWEISAVVVTQAIMTDEIWEIFYLKKDVTDAGTDSPPG